MCTSEKISVISKYNDKIYITYLLNVETDLLVFSYVLNLYQVVRKRLLRAKHIQKINLDWPRNFGSLNSFYSTNKR